MSQNNIYIPETYEDFAYRIQLAEDLPKGDRGYIFMGNSRAGKSTLALAMSGAQMKIVKGEGGLFYINPVDEDKYKGIVLNIQKSVTEKPNFYKPNPMNGNNFAIVDMPGHADSSRFREMINYHYICTMANNLKQVRFLLVIVMPYKNGRYHLTEQDIKMLDSFREMFPKLNPQDNMLDIIINRAEKIGDKFADQVKKNFFENLKNVKSK